MIALRGNNIYNFGGVVMSNITDEHTKVLEMHAGNCKKEYATEIPGTKKGQGGQDLNYGFDIINEGIEKRLKLYGICCSQGGCK